MVKQCCVCTKQFVRGEGVSFHGFPKKIFEKKIWFSILNISENTKLSKFTYVCSDHFHDDDFIVKPSGVKYLKCGAVPKVNFVPEMINQVRNGIDWR
ncbi:hypothetical protein FQR65_LT05848 [Abscondita terminalis]|nr:hypothetical protein FQR65_LT05848 [Abscondita terminalis]